MPSRLVVVAFSYDAPAAYEDVRDEHSAVPRAVGHIAARWIGA